MDGSFALVALNFLCVLLLFGICAYLVSEITSIKLDIERMKEYDKLNEHQLTNMVNDINDNDQTLENAVNAINGRL